MRGSIGLTAAVFFAATTCVQAATVDDFGTGSVACGAAGTMMYRLFTPAVVTGQKYPLVIGLHGIGERGNNNTSQVRDFLPLAAEAHQAAHPSFVLVPQCPGGWFWAGTDNDWVDGVYLQPAIAPTLAAVKHIIDSLVTVLPIDTNRLYITGLSMGGSGTWDMVMRYPLRFAAAVPVCSMVDTTKIAAITALPIWWYHGEVDNIIPPLGDRTAARKLIELGQTVLFPQCGAVAPAPCANMTPAALLAAIPTARKLYTELAGVSHYSWGVAYSDTMMYRWMFLQSKGGPTNVKPAHPTFGHSAAPTDARVELFTLSGTKVGKATAGSFKGFCVMRNGLAMVRAR